MKNLLCILCLCLCGCSSTNLTKVIQALSKDPAIVKIRVTSLYGTIDFVRVGSTNSLTVEPDGSIKVK